MKSRALSIWYHFATVTLLLATLDTLASGTKQQTTWAACTDASCGFFAKTDKSDYKAPYDNVRNTYGQATCHLTGSKTKRSGKIYTQSICSNGLTPYYGCSRTGRFSDALTGENGEAIQCNQGGSDFHWVWCNSRIPNLVLHQGHSYLICLPSGE